MLEPMVMECLDHPYHEILSYEITPILQMILIGGTTPFRQFHFPYPHSKKLVDLYSSMID
jgi:hypothetical protein